jgi:hypothetical protein
MPRFSPYTPTAADALREREEQRRRARESVPPLSAYSGPNITASEQYLRWQHDIDRMQSINRMHRQQEAMTHAQMESMRQILDSAHLMSVPQHLIVTQDEAARIPAHFIHAPNTEPRDHWASWSAQEPAPPPEWDVVPTPPPDDTGGTYGTAYGAGDTATRFFGYKTTRWTKDRVPFEEFPIPSSVNYRAFVKRMHTIEHEVGAAERQRARENNLRMYMARKQLAQGW